MDELDRRIAAVLDRNEPDLAQSLQEPGFFALAFSTMRGPQGWVTWILIIVQTAMFLAALWAGWHFYTAVDVLAAVKWGITAATLAILATQIKLSLVPQMQANRVMLALRRLELRLAARQ